VAITEPFSDAVLAHHTKAVDGYLGQANKWKGVPKASPGTPFGLLQQNFEADMSLSFWKAFREPNKVQSKVGVRGGARTFSSQQLTNVHRRMANRMHPNHWMHTICLDTGMLGASS
jgi:hypothetical protein